jgi:hypothetical protein
MIHNDLFNEILIKPSNNCNQLNIISGYASPAMANKHLATLQKNISINLIVGMVPYDGIGLGGHNGFKALATDSAKFSCNYLITKPAVHIKSYIWLENGVPKVAFTGSGNYSQNAFFGGTIESFAEDDPITNYELFQSIQKNTLNCLSNEIENKVKLYKEGYKPNSGNQFFEIPELMKSENKALFNDIITENCVTLTLLDTRTGNTHKSSGLNWGQRIGREQNQAYIPIPKIISKSGFFPPRANHFTLITDDNESFDCVVAQDGDKAIHSTKDNSLLGKYFRKRLGVPLNTFVTIQHLQIYGRTNVQIYKIDNETYFMDFSV